MKTPAWITFIYGIIILLGGFMGYSQADSTTSLIMGLIFGILRLIALFDLEFGLKTSKSKPETLFARFCGEIHE